jgi:hypothetical protein
MNNEININLDAIIPSSRGIGSSIGSLLGQPYFEVEARVCWPGGKEKWDADEEKVKLGQITTLMPNRVIRRIRLSKHEIRSAQYYKNINGDLGIVINLEADGTYKMFFPLTNDALKMGRGAVDAITAALKNQGDNFFLNAAVTANIVNEANKSELANVRALRETLNKVEQQLIGAIADNEKMAIEAKKEIESTKISDVDIKAVINGNTSAHIEVHQNEVDD